MKILRSRTPGELDKCFELATLKRLDNEDGRHRLNGAQVEALLGMTTAVNLFRHCTPIMEQLARETGQLTKLRSLYTQQFNLLKDIVNSTARDQLITIANNAYDVIVTLSSSPIEGCYNMRRSDLHTLADNVLTSCAMSCGKNRDESKTCPVRRALETIPGVKAAGKQQGNSMDCPFAGLEMEWEGDD